MNDITESLQTQVPEDNEFPFGKATPASEDDNAFPFGSAQEVDKGESFGAMPFVNKSIAETLGLPMDILAGVVNIIPGVDIDTPLLGSESIKKGMEMFLGAVIPEREPQTIGEHAGAGLGEVAGFLVPSSAGMKLLKAGKGVASKVTNTIVQSMAKHPALTMVSESGGGVGMGTARYAAEDVESPMLKTSAEIAGGVAGSLAPSLLLNTPTQMAIRSGKNILRLMSTPFTEKGATYRAGKFVKGQVADPTTVAGTVGEETIGDLPPAVAAGEERLVKLYKDLLSKDLIKESGSVEDISKSIIALEAEMRALGYGSPEILADITRQRVAALELRMDRRILEAVSTAREKLKALPMTQRRSQEAVTVRTELEKTMRSELDAVNELWASVDKDFPTGFNKTRELYASLIEDLSVAQKVDIPKPLKKNPILHDPELDSTTLKEMQGLRSKLLETARIAGKDGEWNKARIAGEISDSILEDLTIASTNAQTEHAANLQAALAATRRFKTRFESGVVGKILGRAKSGAPAIDPTLTLDISIGRKGLQGAVDLEKVLVTPEARAAGERYVARSYTDYTLNPDGEINQIKHSRWMMNNEEILDQFPDLRAQLGDASDAQYFADVTKAKMNARKLAISKTGLTAEFLRSANLGNDIKAATNSLKLTRDLVLKASKDKSGKALDGLRAGFIEHLLERSHIGGYSSSGERVLSGNTISGLMNKENSILKEVFTPEQLRRMRSVASELSKVELYEKTSGTAEINLDDMASSFLRLVSRVGGAQIGRVIAGWTGGGTVQTPGIFSEKVQSFMGHLTKDRALQLINDAVLSKDPKLLKTLLLPLDNPKARLDSIVSFSKTINAWLLGSGKRVYDDIVDEMNETDPSVQETTAKINPKET